MQNIRIEILKAILKNSSPKNLHSLSEELHIEPNELRNELMALREMGLVMLSKGKAEKKNNVIN